MAQPITSAATDAIPRNKTNVVLLVAAALVLLSIVVSLYLQYQARELRNDIMALAVESGKHLQNALADPAAETAALDRHAQSVIDNLDKLRATSNWLDRKVADAADGYVHVIREILKQRASSQHHYRATVGQLKELQEHIEKRYKRDASWASEAIQRKEQMEKDYFYYRLASDALLKLLPSYAADRSKLIALLDPTKVPSPAMQLPDAPIADNARGREMQAAKQLAADIEKVRKLPRGD